MYSIAMNAEPKENRRVPLLGSPERFQAPVTARELSGDQETQAGADTSGARVTMHPAPVPARYRAAFDEEVAAAFDGAATAEEYRDAVRRLLRLPEEELLLSPLLGHMARARVRVGKLDPGGLRCSRVEPNVLGPYMITPEEFSIIPGEHP